MSKVYTKTGDAGMTGLVGGSRVSKADQRILIYGELDELNSWIGVSLSHIDKKQYSKEVDRLILIQNILFSLGSEFACEADKREQFKLPKTHNKDVENLEKYIDEYQKFLSPLKNFILPGGDCSASFLHICRTVCRRIERNLVTYGIENLPSVPDNSLEFLNRLSDFFFVLSRYFNLKNNNEEIIWKA
jgi:cob(I)alamin adenosyltransferase